MIFLLSFVVPRSYTDTIKSQLERSEAVWRGRGTNGSGRGERGERRGLEGCAIRVM